MSPEVLLNKNKIINYKEEICFDETKEDQSYYTFGMKSDMWAIGVIAYILICQDMPFGFGREG